MVIFSGQIRLNWNVLYLVARKRYLIDGMRVAAWLSWEFFHARWKIYFCVEGSIWGGCEMRLPCEVRMVMWGDFCVVEGTTRHDKGMQGGHKVTCKVRMVMWGDFCMVEGATGHKGTWGGCKMRIVMQGEFCAVEGRTQHTLVTLCGCKTTQPKAPCMHLAWMWDDYFWMRCYFGCVKMSNDEDFQKFYLYTFGKVTSCGCKTTQPKSPCVHLVWTQAKVILHGCKVTTFE